MSAPEQGPWERKFDAALGFAASVILFSLMIVTFVDVVGRYGFNRPLRGAFEGTELMLLVLIFAGLPLVSHADEHVTMDFIDHMVGPAARRVISALAQFVCAVTLIGLSWLIWLKAGKIAAYGDTTDVLKILLAPFVYFMAAMIALSGLIHAWRIFKPGKASAGGPTT
ncbi:MAG: TRAP transporter small permease [Betaproteobacteria bacterium]|nr:TRAP transporter small permease [Betaproteobacteria bacterium]